MVERIAFERLHLSAVYKFRIHRIEEVRLFSLKRLIAVFVVLVAYFCRDIMLAVYNLVIGQDLVEVGCRGIV